MKRCAHNCSLLLVSAWSTTRRMSCRAVRRFGYFLALVFLSCSASIAQIPQVPTDVKPGTVTPDEGDKKPDYSKEGYVIEEIHARYRFENDGTGREERKLRVRVQSEAGVQGWGQLRLRAASHPTLAKNARMGHARGWCCIQGRNRSQEQRTGVSAPHKQTASLREVDS